MSPFFLDRSAYSRFKAANFLEPLNRDFERQAAEIALDDPIASSALDRLDMEFGQQLRAIQDEALSQPVDASVLDRLDAEFGAQLRVVQDEALNQPVSASVLGEFDADFQRRLRELDQPERAVTEREMAGNVPFVPEDLAQQPARRAAPPLFPSEPADVIRGAARLAGIPQLPRPGEAPLEAFRTPESTVERIAEELPGRQFVAPGPGGVGIFDPRLQPDVAEALERTPGRIRLGPAGEFLEEAAEEGPRALIPRALRSQAESPEGMGAPRPSEPPAGEGPTILPGPPVRRSEQEIVAPAQTEATGIADPNQRYQFRVKVVSLDELVPSQTDTLEPNPAFPAELQPRVRDRAASRVQIDRIAQTLSPDALLSDVRQLDRGPMIVGPDNLVESGNGRTLALRRARAEHPEVWQAYQQALRQRLGAYGLTEQDIAGIADPVLVRERITPVDRVAFAAEANQTTSLAMSPFETALQDAGRLRDETLSLLEVGENQSIDQALKSAANRPIVQAFLQAIPETERAAILSGAGELTPAGLQRLKSGLFAKTYQGEAGRVLTETFTESLDPGIKNVEAGMFGSLPAMARAEGLIRSVQRDASLSLSEDLAKAVNVLARLREQGMRVEQYLSQASLFERELTPVQATLLEHLALLGRSPRRVREMLNEYAAAVEAAPDPRQGSMFGLAGPTKEDILGRIIRGQQEQLGAEATPLFREQPPSAFEQARPAEPAQAEAPAPVQEGPQLAGAAAREPAVAPEPPSAAPSGVPTGGQPAPGPLAPPRQPRLRVPQEPPLPPRLEQPVPVPGQGIRLRGSGRWDLPEDVEQGAIRAWEEQRPLAQERISWESTINELAPQVGVSPEELAARWRDAPQAQVTRELAVAKAGLADVRGRVSAIERRLEAEADALSEGEAGALRAEIADLKLQEAMLMFGIIRRGGEIGRALNFLRAPISLAQVDMARVQYEQLGRVTKRLRDRLAKAIKTGELDATTERDLIRLARSLEREAAEEGRGVGPAGRAATGSTAARGAGTTPRPRQPRREESLAQQLVEINRQQARARDSGDFDAAEALEPERERVRAELKEIIRERTVRAMEREREPATQETVDRVLASEILRVLRGEVAEELQPERTAGRIGEDFGRSLEQAIRREEQRGQRLITQISKEVDRRFDAAWRRMVRVQAEITRATERAMDEEARRAIPLLERRIEQAQRRGDVEAVASLQAELDQTLEALSRRLLPQVIDDLRRATGGRPGQRAIDRREQADLARHIKAVLRRRVTGEPSAKAERAALAAGVEAGRGLEREVVREVLDSIRRMQQAGFNRADAERLLGQLSNLSLEASRAVARQRKVSATHAVKRLLTEEQRKLPPEERRAIIEHLAEEFSRLDTSDPRAAARFAAAMARPDFWEYAHAYRVGSILSGPPTLALQPIGVIIEGAAAPVDRFAAAGLEAAVSAARPGRPRSANLQEVAAEVQGMWEALPIALADGWATLRTGYSSRPIRELRGHRADLFGQEVEFFRQRLGTVGLVGDVPLTATSFALSPLNLALRWFAAVDDFGRTLHVGGALRANAVREARRRGISVEDVLDNPLRFPEVYERASQEAAKRTYLDRLDGLAKLIQSARVISEPARQLLPFFQTIASLTRQGFVERTPAALFFDIPRTPIGEAAKLAKAGKVDEAAAVRGRALVGTLLMFMGYVAAEQGLVTAFGPHDAKERADWRDQNGAMFAGKVLGTWVPIMAIGGALAIPFMLGAAASEAKRQVTSSQEARNTIQSYIDLGLQFSARSGAMLIDSAGLRGMGDFLRAVQRPEDYGQRFIESYASSWVPFSGYLATLAQSEDPTVRDPEGVLEYIATRLPAGLRELAGLPQAPERLTQTGRTLERTGGAGALLPTRGRGDQPDPILQEFQRLRAAGQDVSLGTAGTTVRGLALARDEQQQYQRVLGQTFQNQLGRLIQSERYRRADAAGQAQMLRDAEQAARQAAADRLWEMLPEDRRRGHLGAQRAERGLPPKYLGVDDPLEEARIDEAISQYRAWLDEGPRPERETIRLAERYLDRINPAYRRALRQRGLELEELRGLIEAPPSVPAGSITAPPPLVRAGR